MSRLVFLNLNESARTGGRRHLLRTGLIAVLSLAVTAVMVISGPTVAYAANVSFADENLAACISDELALPSETATFDSSDLAAVASLDCSYLDIAELSGIEALSGLTDLDLSGNEIADVTPLAGLTGLENLDLSFNRISKLDALAGLTRVALDASGQEIEWRIKVGVATLLPLAPVTSPVEFEGSYSKALKFSKWRFTAKSRGSYYIHVEAIDAGYDFDVTYWVTAYSVKSFKGPKPKITGKAAVGNTLKANAGTWKPSTASLSYQWYRSGKKVSGATAQTYVLTKADLGKKITVKVTGRQAEYKTATATSKATGKVKAGTIVPGAVAVSGTIQVGQVVTATTNAADWAPNTVALSYQWYRSGKAIKGAKAATYTTLAADRGKKLSVKISAKLSGYTTRIVSINAGVVTGL